MAEVSHRPDIRKAILVSHTHWDREWYRTFQGFCARLDAEVPANALHSIHMRF